VLFTGLLIGGAGGAIAAADPNAGDSAAKSQGVNAPSQGVDGPSQSANSASGPAGTVANNLLRTVRQTVLGVTHTLGSLGKPSQQSAGANTHSDKNGSGVTAATTTPVESNSNDIAPATNADAAATDPVAPVSRVVEPITNAVATVASTVESVPAVVMSLPTSATPVFDVITTVQNLLTSVSNAVVLLEQLPSDLASLLGVTAVDTAVLTAGGGVSGAGPVAAADAPVIAAPWPQALPGIWGVPLAGNVAAPAALGGIATAGLSQEVSTSGVAPLVPAGVIPSDVLSILEHTVGALLVPASLSALAAVALPGVGGLLIICAAGIRVGYRQAKAGWAVRITGVARFAGPAPLGVVRSGSPVALRPRALRVVPPDASRVAFLLDQVA
jgi:hypothetical protein